MSDRTRPRTFLVITQVYTPDTPAVGQHIAQATAELARRGHRVVVHTSANGYEDGSVRFPRRETVDGVEIVRLPFSSFGKKSFPIRALAGLLFVIQSTLRGLFMRVDGVLVSTAPPFASIAAITLRILKRTPFTFWAMDLNPDQLIALGTMTERSPVARVFNALNRSMLKRAFAVIALDRFMAESLNRKRDIGDRMHVIPPGPLEDAIDPIEHEDNPFRATHGLEGKLVVMYAGNHGLTTPVDTLVDAALRMQDRERLVFMFIGAGLAKKAVTDAIERHAPTNIISLPYQPFSEIRYSLSAADVHAVTIVPEVVGVVHPCKIYGAMAVRRPVVLVGPEPSHVSDLVEKEGFGWRVDYGDTDRLVEVLDEILATDPGEMKRLGEQARTILEERFSHQKLFGGVADLVESMADGEPSHASDLV